GAACGLASPGRLCLVDPPVVGSRRLVLGEALGGERQRCAAVAGGVVTAAVQQDPYEQGQHQPQEPGQDQDEAHDVHVQDMGGGGGDGEPQEPPGRDQREG